MMPSSRPAASRVAFLAASLSALLLLADEATAHPSVRRTGEGKGGSGKGGSGKGGTGGSRSSGKGGGHTGGSRKSGKGSKGSTGAHDGWYPPYVPEPAQPAPPIEDTSTTTTPTTPTTVALTTVASATATPIIVAPTTVASGTVAPTTVVTPTTVASATDAPLLHTSANYPDEIYPYGANFSCGATETVDHINPCVTYGAGTYPHGLWWDTLRYGNSATSYIECTGGAEADCAVLDTAEDMVWNPYMSDGLLLASPEEIGATPPGQQTSQCGLLTSECRLAVGSSRYNTCLDAANGNYNGRPVTPTLFLAYDLEKFCNGAPVSSYIMAPEELPQSQTPEEILEIPEGLVYESKFIECNTLGGCTIRLCDGDMVWNQMAQACEVSS